jgi:ADP-ribosyl-[dinitrogen reductase] hydrolase
MPLSLRERVRGALLGLATGDALGVPLEFRRPGTFAPISSMVGGGLFGLKPGEWTDDTSMALCLVESLIHRRKMDLRDQIERYVRWWRMGHLSSTGSCFDIGETIRAALSQFIITENPVSGPTHRRSAGNGSIMRLAPVPLFFSDDPEEAIEASAASSTTTHGAPVAVHACRLFGALIAGAAAGHSKEELLAPGYSPVAGYWERAPLVEEIAEISSGSYREKPASQIRGSGYAAESLEAALWAFHASDDFREGCLKAVNLGDDADTTGAIFGQLAGAYYGADAIPADWLEKLARRELLEDYADRLVRTIEQVRLRDSG